MSMCSKYLVAGFLIFLLGGSPSINAGSQGFLEGHLKIIFGMAVEPSDDMPRPEGKPQSYAEYSLIILSQGEKKKIVHVQAEENGNYRVGMPPVNYVVDLQVPMGKYVLTSR